MSRFFNQWLQPASSAQIWSVTIKIALTQLTQLHIQFAASICKNRYFQGSVDTFGDLHRYLRNLPGKD